MSSSKAKYPETPKESWKIVFMGPGFGYCLISKDRYGLLKVIPQKTPTATQNAASEEWLKEDHQETLINLSVKPDKPEGPKKDPKKAPKKG